MSFNLVKKVTAADGTVTYTQDAAERGFMTIAADVVKAPLNVFGSEGTTTFVSKRENAITALVWGGTLGLIGELVGYKGAQKGRKAILANLPFLG